MSLLPADLLRGCYPATLRCNGGQGSEQPGPQPPARRRTWGSAASHTEIRMCSAPCEISRPNPQTRRRVGTSAEEPFDCGADDSRLAAAAAVAADGTNVLLIDDSSRRGT